MVEGGDIANPTLDSLEKIAKGSWGIGVSTIARSPGGDKACS